MIRSGIRRCVRLSVAAISLLFACSEPGPVGHEQEPDGIETSNGRDSSPPDALLGASPVEDCRAPGSEVEGVGTVWAGPCVSHRSKWSSDESWNWFWLYETTQHGYNSTGLPVLLVTDRYYEPYLDFERAVSRLSGTTDRVETFEYDERGRLVLHRTHFRHFDNPYVPESMERSTPFPEVPVDLTDWGLESIARWYQDDHLGRLHMYAEDDRLNLPERPAYPTKDLYIYEYVGDTALVLRETRGSFAVQADGTWGLQQLTRTVTESVYDERGRVVRRSETGERSNDNGEYVWSPVSEVIYEYDEARLVTERWVRFPWEGQPEKRWTVNHTQCPDASCRWSNTVADDWATYDAERYVHGQLVFAQRYSVDDYYDWESEQNVYDDAGNRIMRHEGQLPDGYDNTVYDYSCWDGSAPIAPPSFATPAPLDFP